MLVRNENIKLFAPPVLPIDRSDRRTSLYGSGQTCFMENVEEIWKDIPSYEGRYQASNMGRLKSLRRKVVCGKGWYYIEERIWVGKDSSQGYKIAELFSGGKKKTLSVHRLVCAAFLPNPEQKRTVNHKNGIKSDNRIENLEWSTYSENAFHSYRVLGRTGSDKLRAHASKLVFARKNHIKSNV